MRLFRPLALILVMTAASTVASHAAAQDRVRTTSSVRVNVWGDTSNYNRHLRTVQDTNGVITLTTDDGATWEVQEVQNGLKRDIAFFWEAGDRLTLRPDPASLPGQPLYRLSNRNKAPYFIVQVKPTGYSSQLSTHKFVTGIHIFDDPNQPKMFYLDTDFAIVNDLYENIVATWQPGENVLIEVTEELREQEGINVAVESLLVINPRDWSWALAIPAPQYDEYN